MKLRFQPSLLLVLLLAFLVAGCSGVPVTSSTTNPDPLGLTASGPAASVRFDPSVADVPLPMDILRNPTTGFNALPGMGEPYTSFNSLQGFSPAGPILINFSALVDANSVNANDILVINTGTGTPAPVFFETMVLTAGRCTVKVWPTVPLTPFTQYLVIVTNRVTSGGQPVTSSQVAGLLKFGGALVDGDGNSTVSSLTNAQAQALEPLRAAWQAVWAGAEAATGQARGDIPFAWTFTTQPLFQTLPVLRTRMQTTAVVPVILQSYVGAAQVDAFYNGLGLGAVPHDAIAAVYVGAFQSPNYLSDPLNGPFQGTPSNPTQLGTTTVPFIATVGASTAGGTMIFGHGITRSKGDVLVLANGANSNNLGALCIDFVLHGDRSLPGQPSGTGFINLDNLRMTRDNIRQSVNDLFALTRMISSGNTDFNGDLAPDLRTDNITYSGQSLGGIVGTTFVATEANVRTVVLNVPGGRLVKLLIESPTFSPVIIAGLAAAGIQQGTPAFEQFLWIAQTVVDDADSENYAPHVLNGDLKGSLTTNVLVQEMLGDTVAPNSATTDLVRALGIRHVLGVQGGVTPSGVLTVNAPYVGSGLFQYWNGGHSFLLDPAQGPTAQAQTQLYTDLMTGLFPPPGPTIIDPFAAPRAAEPTWRFPVDLNLETLFRF